MDEVARPVEGAETQLGPVRLRNCIGTFEVDGRVATEEVLHVVVTTPVEDHDMERFCRFLVQYVTARAVPPAGGAIRPFSVVYDMTEATSILTLSPAQLMTLVKTQARCGDMYKDALTCTVICLSNAVMRAAINGVLQPPIYKPVRPLTFAPSLDSQETLLFFRKARAERHATRR